MTIVGASVNHKIEHACGALSDSFHTGEWTYVGLHDWQPKKSQASPKIKIMSFLNNPMNANKAKLVLSLK